MASSSSSFLLFLVFSLALLSSSTSESTSTLSDANDLSFTFYKSKCPNLETIVRSHLQKAFATDIGLAAGLLRLHFHDCFVQGCDASVLLDGSASGPSEKAAPPNLTLRPAAFKAINDLRLLIDQACGQVVSCADVVALAARDSVALSGGPNYRVPLGRRDGLTFATRNATLAGLPAPSSNASTLLAVLQKINLDAEDLVALSGGHTIGIAHCTSFTGRLYPSQDPTMNKSFASGLRLTCPAADTDNTTALDRRTPNAFDNKYYVDLVNREGLFTSDQDLLSDPRTGPFVWRYALDQRLFFARFAASMVKMGEVGVLTGNSGEIRANCSARNAGGKSVWSVVEEVEEVAAETAAAF
ncbi:peroxidase 12-like [Iris pallida]|uniref:Peroxidase n=1 Tax=Iris pallida TaxID=29817 RepID=A0AAX6H085_IRIPA|nr:peroxidase 12-like [Iris pallida]